MTCCPPVIALHSLSVRYGPHLALQDVSGQFRAGSLTAIAGPNGAGKSTLLKAIAGILRPTQGEVILSPEIAGRVGYLPQISAVQRDYPLTVGQAVATGLWPEIGNYRRLSPKMKESACRALADVGLEESQEKPVGDLSGGQFQRMLFARLLLQDPQVLLLDEPFAAIDAETTRKLIALLLDWHKKGKTIICVLHDLLLIKKYFPESMLLAGKCLGRGHTHELFEQKLLSFDLDMAELREPGEVHDHD